MSHKITVGGGKSVRLPTAGKYCDRDIEVTAEAGGVELPELKNPGSAADLMEDKELIGQDGEVIAGSIVNRGLLIANLSPNNPESVSEAGYYGYVAVAALHRDVTITPSKSQQVAGGSDVFINNVTVKPIPDNYQDISGVTVTPETLGEGITAIDAAGNLIVGTAKFAATITLEVDANGNATISGAAFTVDDDGNATIASSTFTVDAEGNATI